MPAKRKMSQRTLDKRFLKAAFDENLRDLKSLVKAGANIEAQDEYGWTALDLLSAEGNVKAVSFLLKQGANPATLSHQGQTALLSASGNGQLAVTNLLLASGSDPNHCDEKGLTSLHRIGEKIYAWQSGGTPDYTETVKVLLSAGANPNAQDGKGHTPLHLLPHMETLTVARFLLEAGADPNLKNNQGQTVLDVIPKSLQESEQAALKALLKKHGATKSRVKKKAKVFPQYLDVLFGRGKAPELLKSLYDFEEELLKEHQSLGPLFGLVLFRTEAHDSGKRPPDCLPFARTRGSRTHFAVWRCSGQTHLATAPIVMYSEDLMPQARVIAKDLKRFLSLVLAVRRVSILPEVEMYPERIKQVQANYQRVPAAYQELQQYSERLRERFHLKPRQSPVSYIQSWRRKYPELEEWTPEHTVSQRDLNSST